MATFLLDPYNYILYSAKNNNLMWVPTDKERSLYEYKEAILTEVSILHIYERSLIK
jgi:hypothetical protein